MYMNIPIYLYIYVYIFSLYMSLCMCLCVNARVKPALNRRVFNLHSGQASASMIGGANSSRLKPFRERKMCSARFSLFGAPCVCYYNNTIILRYNGRPLTICRTANSGNVPAKKNSYSRFLSMWPAQLLSHSSYPVVKFK